MAGDLEISRGQRLCLFWIGLIYGGLGLALISIGSIWDSEGQSSNDDKLFSVFDKRNVLIYTVAKPSLFWTGVLILPQALQGVVVMFLKSRVWTMAYILGCILSLSGVTGAMYLSIKIWTEMQVIDHAQDSGQCMESSNTSGCICKLLSSLSGDHAVFSGGGCRQMIALNELIAMYFCISCLSSFFAIVAIILGFKTWTNTTEKVKRRLIIRHPELPAAIETVFNAHLIYSDRNELPSVISYGSLNPSIYAGDPPPPYGRISRS